jgi:hypothetical protein
VSFSQVSSVLLPSQRRDVPSADLLTLVLYTHQRKFGTPMNVDPPRELISFQEAKKHMLFFAELMAPLFFSTLGKPCQGKAKRP